MSYLACLPPALQRQGDSLAAPAVAGQGAGIRYLGLRMRAASRPGRRISSYSALRRAFSALLWLMKRTVAIPPITMTATAVAQTKLTIESTEEPLWLLALLVLLLGILANAVFHWLMVPLVNWVAEKLA